jgi:hypothetical protein
MKESFAGTRLASNGKLRLIAVAITVGVTLAVITTAGADHSVLERVSVGANGTGNSSSVGAAASFAGSSTDGLREFFDTKEALVPEDTDGSTDLYERSPAQTTLISTSSTAGNGAFDALYAGASDAGSRVFFHTREALVPGDTDSNHYDIYERFNGVTTLISTGPSSTNAPVDAFFRGASVDGTKVFFETSEILTASDTKARSDVYQRQASTTTLVSTGSTAAAGSFFARFRGASLDGSLVFFESDDRLTASDTDLESDVYERNVGTSTTTLRSIGPNGGNAAVPAFFDSSSDTGSRVFFHTAERLDTTADTDGFIDVYERAGSTTTIVTTSATGGNGPRHADFAGSSADGATAYFETDESMLSADTDASFDVYKRIGGVTTLMSDGTAGSDPNVDATALGVSDDGTRVWFDTTEQIQVIDTDARFDIYERLGAATTLVSQGISGGNGAFDAFFATVSGDGTRVIFDTAESLVAADTDSAFDTYERQGGTLTLISKGPYSGSGAFNVTFAGATPNATSVFLHSAEQLAADDTDTVQDVYRATLASGGYPRSKGATPFRASLVPAYAKCNTPNTTHGPPPPLNVGSCKVPTMATTTNDVTVGTPDANGAGANSTGFVLFRVAGTVNVLMTGSISDVRCGPGTTTPAKCTPANSTAGADYVGELQLEIPVRMSDRWNSTATGGGDHAATMQDFNLRATFPCASTAATTQGSICTLNTSANALFPGLAVDSRRATWEVGQIVVNDGGPDGLISTPTGNKAFAKQGVFAP